jgi:hypothetical protein
VKINATSRTKICTNGRRRLPGDLLENVATAAAFVKAIHDDSGVSTGTKRNTVNIWTLTLHVLAHTYRKKRLQLRPEVAEIFKKQGGPVADQEGGAKRHTVNMLATREMVQEHTLLIFDTQRPAQLLSDFQHAWVDLLPSVVQGVAALVDEYATTGSMSSAAQPLKHLMLYIVAGMQILHPTQRIEIPQLLRLCNSVQSGIPPTGAGQPGMHETVIRLHANNRPTGKQHPIRGVLLMPLWPEGVSL